MTSEGISELTELRKPLYFEKLPEFAKTVRHQTSVHCMMTQSYCHRQCCLILQYFQMDFLAPDDPRSNIYIMFENPHTMNATVHRQSSPQTIPAATKAPKPGLISVH